MVLFFKKALLLTGLEPFPFALCPALPRPIWTRHGQDRNSPYAAAGAGRGSRRLYRGNLCRARQPGSSGRGRVAAGRPADDHHRCRELSGLCRPDPGSLADGADGGAGEGRGGSAGRRPGRFVRSRRSAIPVHRRQRQRLSCRYARHRHRRAGALARPAVGKRRCRAPGYRPAPPATGSSIVASGSPWSAAAIPRWRRRFI